ncbi:MAG: hypothetical protein IH600_10770 [Bacteroidetes bacterium]|nr:hypothetical protein [Bacteroidota bacterium]
MAKEGKQTRKSAPAAKAGAGVRQSSETKGANAPVKLPLTRDAKFLFTALAVFLLLRGLIVALHPAELRLWGIDFAAWLGATPLVFILVWLPLIFLLPSVANLFLRTRQAGSKGEANPRSRLVWAALLTLAVGAAAWWIQVAYAFLGDGTWYAAELYRSMTLPEYANSMIKPSAWLTGLLLDGFARTFHPADIRLPFAIAGVAGMLIAAAAVFFTTRRESASTVFVSALFLLGGSGTLVFLGYIELYSLTYACSIAYLVAGWQCLRGHVPILLPVVLLLFSLLFGASAVVWVPSMLLLLHWKYRGEEGAFPLRRAAIVLILLPLAGVAALYVLGGTANDNAYLVALTPYERVVEGLRTGWQRYVLSAPERWADIGNMLLLGLGPLAFVAPVLVWIGRREGMLRRPSVLFAATAAAGGLTLLLFGNTFLGLARDWDVGAFALLGTAMLALVLWTEARMGTRRAVLPLLAAAILSQLVLWVGVNTGEQSSARRFESIAAMDAGLLLPMNTFTAYENLRKFHQSGGETQAYFRVLRRQIETGYRAHIGYAEYLSSLLQLTDAAQRRTELSWLFDTYEHAAAVRGSADDFRTIPLQDAREFAARLLLSAWQIGERDLVLGAEAAFRKQFQEWPEISLLEIMMEAGDSGEGDLSRIAAAVTPDTRDPFLHMTAGGLYQQRGAYDRAEAEYDIALEREPSLYPSWYLVAADLQLNLTGDREKARLLLERGIRNAPTSPEARRARELLRQF